MNYLFVCTGNTCRSPMAQCLMARLSGENCQSAGLYAAVGQSASPGAVNAMAALGLDLSGHRSQPVTAELLDWADRVWAMTEGHLHALKQMFPQYTSKFHVFDPPVPDPFGGDDALYQMTALALWDQLSQITAKP